MSDLYALVNLPHPSGAPVEEITRALIADGQGAATIQLRAKEATTAERKQAVAAMAPVCQEHGIPFYVNDDIVVATSGIPGISGVHWGQSDIEKMRALGELERNLEQLRKMKLSFGVSTHRFEELEPAINLGAAYLGFGPVFATGSKRNPEPCVGVDGLRRACALASVPIVAIGGVEGNRIKQCVRAGADSVAMISSLVASTTAEMSQRAIHVAQQIHEHSG